MVTFKQINQIDGRNSVDKATVEDLNVLEDHIVELLRFTLKNLEHIDEVEVPEFHVIPLDILDVFRYMNKSAVNLQFNIKVLLNSIETIYNIFDEASADDGLGTEGWKHSIGMED